MEKIKTEPVPALAFNLLTDTTRITLFDEAADLAYQTFEDPTDGHIECVYVRLMLNHIGGGWHEGAVTVH
ncbi:hypothetical protein D7I39_11015 [Allopusillimonas ginsengisoli]|nr:hypothetical protein D7I39_11015 [Allopusillimonas ginsengisoli]